MAQTHLMSFRLGLSLHHLLWSVPSSQSTRDARLTRPDLRPPWGLTHPVPPNAANTPRFRLKGRRDKRRRPTADRTRGGTLGFHVVWCIVPRHERPVWDCHRLSHQSGPGVVKGGSMGRQDGSPMGRVWGWIFKRDGS